MKVDRFRFLSIVLISLLAMGTLLSAQEIDDRIWSMTYWKKLADQGLVTLTAADETSHQPPQIPNSRIYAKSVLIDDSPDVPVTTQTNVTQSETSIFINPNDDQKLLNSNNSTNFPVTTIYGASYFLSTDAGLSWSGSEQGAGGTQGGDPAAAIDLSGRYYIGYIAADDGNGCAYSTDEGLTWTHVQVTPIPGPGGLADKNHLWVDNSPASPYEGNLYASWTDFGGADDGEIMISRSTDSGLSWSPKTNISSAINAGSHNQGVNVQTGPNGEVYVVWLVYDAWPATGNALAFTKSTDGGATWATATRILSNIKGIRNQAPDGGLGGGKTMRCASFPSMTVSSSGDIYVVWTNQGIPGVNSGDPDNYLIKSTDGGSTWSTPSRVNQDPIGNGKDQWFPWIACDPSTGFLVCIFYDSRNFAANDQAETFVATSTDGANTWEDFKVSDVSWNGDGFPGFGGSYAGDYIGIDILNGKVYPVWADVRGGQLNAWVSPFLLADPTDPNPPSDFDAYSDYTTPTSMALTWADPTNLANGDTLLPANFQIHILRDDIQIDSVAGGIEQYTDIGLNDGVVYTYSLFTKMLTNDSTSLSVNASWTAGGSRVPERPTAFSLTNAGGGQLMAHWMNPSDNIDGTPMDDFDAINLYEDGSLLATFTRSPGDTGSADSALFTPGGANLPYYLTAVDNESPPNESVGSNTAYPPFSAPYTQDFETGGVMPVQWTNETDDDFDWTLDAGGTTSSGTGPTVDHTTGTTAGYYMYTESSTPNFPNMIAHLTTPFIDLSTVTQPGMAFWYHMHGAAMGELHVDVYANGVWNLDAMTPLIGQQQPNQTDPWLQAVIDLSPYVGAPIQVRFRGITGTSFTSDMAIDDVFFGSLASNPEMVVAPQSIDDTLLVGGMSDYSVLVSNISALPTVLNYTVTEDPAVSWLNVVPTSGAVTSGQSDTLNVTLDATGLSSGSYNTQLIVSGDDTTNSADTVTVSLEVNDAPAIAVAPDTFDVSVASGNILDTTLTIHNTGLGPLNFELVIGGDLPELMYYKFNEAGANQTENFAAPGSPVPPLADVLGSLSMGGTGFEGAALIGAGASSSTSYVNPGWITNISGSWTISLWLSGAWPTTLSYIFGDITAQSFRCFTAGAAGVNGLLLRSPNGSSYDVQLDNVGPGTVIVDYVYDDAALELRGYVNGVLGATVPQPAPIVLSGTDVFKIGGYSTSTGLPAGMLMDEWKWYTRAIDLESSRADFWLSSDTTSGTVAPGDSMQITLTFDPTGLSAGDQETEILVLNNDPINPEVSVGVHMFVIGGGQTIAVSTDSIDFDSVYVGSDSTISFTVENIGGDTLEVLDIFITNAAFSVDTSNFIVPPSGMQEVETTFSPAAQGTHSGLIRIVSNDPANDTLNVAVSGYGEPPVGIENTSTLPKTFGVGPNYPNPFNPTTTIKYQLPRSSDVRLAIYNILGQKVRTLINQRVEPGYHAAEWNGLNDSGKQVATGLYIYRFEAESYVKTMKMMMLK